MQAQELWWQCGEFRMRYLHLAPSLPVEQQQTPVVFVHGLLGYSFSWRHNLGVFAQSRQAYAVDLLGVGRSDRPGADETDYSMGAAAGRLLQWMRSLGHESLDLVGTSHGGAVAMMAAAEDRGAEHPLVRRLVLVAPAHPFMPNARLRLAFFRTPVGRALLRLLGGRSARLNQFALGRMYHDESLITEETRQGYEVNFSDPRSFNYALEVVRCWRGDMAKLLAALHALVNIPTLLVWGEHDPAVSASSGLLLRQFFRNARYDLIPNTGHLPYEEAPAEFNRLLLRFLD
jgi:4,5:9,10-diseco-3-hydroxy-5,9,17-trioxoandrosta-1(10),2-diene-4-oate hydrolase